MMNRKNVLIGIAVAIVVITTIVAGIHIYNSKQDATREMDGYTHLSPSDAETFVENASEDDSIIVDVRGQIAYEQGHIPGAIATWYEDYGTGRLDVLPKLDQKILVYCDYGGLSKEVAKHLVEQGYTNVYEFNGMDVWNGEVIIDDKYNGVEGF